MAKKINRFLKRQPGLVSNTEECVYSFRNPHTGGLLQKQYTIYNVIIKSALGELPYNVIAYGGGVRAGKTFNILFAVWEITKIFPGVQIHIMRDSMPRLEATTIKSFKKLCKTYKRYYQTPGNHRIEFENGSSIYFFPESFDTDKDLDRFKGLETNIFVLEEIQELQQQTFEKCFERMGSWRFPGEPKPLILTTFNPTHVKWVRDKIYLPYKTGKLPENYYVSFGTAKDNPYVSEDQWRAWESMDEMNYKRYVEGDWDVMEAISPFCYKFDRNKHVQSLSQTDDVVYVSFDFNVDPIVCLLAHKGLDFLYIFKEIRIRNSNVYELCDEILKVAKNNIIHITGDATGRNRSAMVRDNQGAYDLIIKYLRLTPKTVEVPRVNMGIRDSRRVCNAVLEKLDVRIDPSCEYLISDLQSVEADDRGEICKIDKKSDPLKSHLLDCFRYYCNTYFYKKYLNVYDEYV